MKLQILVVAALALSISSTAWAAEKVMYQEITDNKPDAGVSVTVYLGDRMVEQRHGQYKECIVPKRNLERVFPLGSGRIFLKKGEPLCKNDSNKKKYTPEYNNFDAMLVKMKLDVSVERSGNLFKLCLDLSKCIKDISAADFDIIPWFFYEKNLYQQTIEYSGRSGEVLKFTYSEFSDGFARQAFTREFQVDLSHGNVAAYKGAVIEIESATNSSITYKVVRNFQQ